MPHVLYAAIFLIAVLFSFYPHAARDCSFYYVVFTLKMSGCLLIHIRDIVFNGKGLCVTACRGVDRYIL